MWTKYVNEYGVDNIKKFKYNGVCDSILYKYVLSDWAQFVVNKMPMWLAPNLITLTGFLFMLVAYILVLIYNPWFDQAVPSWLCYYCAFALFMYQTLDNCDGKQARRTNNSTAMGMLLDHGTDCLVQWIVGSVLMNVTRVQQGAIGYVSVLIAAKVAFFFGVYQQQHTGVFRLDIINGVDEGLPAIQCIFIFTGIVGPNWWTGQSTLLGIQYNSVLLILLVAGGIQASASFSFGVFKLMHWNPVRILYSLRLPITLLATGCSIILLTPTNVLLYWQQLYVLVLGFQWTKMINIWQLSIITKQDFSQLEFSWIFIQLAIVLNLLTQYITADHLCLINEPTLAFVLLVISFITYVHCVASILKQLSSILQINILTINNK